MSYEEIKKVCVIGAGTMGSGIAAHLANAKIDVLLLDVKKSGLGQKNQVAKDALEKIVTTQPAPLMHKRNLKYITPGNIEDDLPQIAECDWVIEVIVEQLETKQKLFEKIDSLRGDQTIISSNTSTIPLHELVQDRSFSFQQHFLITHFFNPPRYMQLLEMVRGQQTHQAVFDRIKDFCDIYLGKGVVECNDTPGFIANRIGTFWLQTALNEAIDQGITIPEVDRIFGKAMGIPKTGVFGLIDLIGVDLIPLIGDSMRQTLPADDPYVINYRNPEIIKTMIEQGYTGRKGKGGFYRLTPDIAKPVKEVINLSNGRYDPVTTSNRFASFDLLGRDMVAFLDAQDPGAQYAWSVLAKTLTYAISLVPEVTDNLYNIDQAMKLGYNWKYGPFELVDRMSPTWFKTKLEASGYLVPNLLVQVADKKFYYVEQGQKSFFDIKGDYAPIKRPEGVLLLEDIKRTTKPVLKNAAAQVWDLGDGVVCFEFISKQNALDHLTIDLLNQTIDLVAQKYKALIIYNEGSHFSVGVNLGLALFAANIAAWDTIKDLIQKGQVTYQKLKYAAFPVVAAPAGMALGGGCEIILHADAIQAHSELYMGLVEVGVGLIPAWGGCTEMLNRWLNGPQATGGTMAALSHVFEMISTARVSKSAMEAQDMMMVRASDGITQDGITMARSRLLHDAKARALAMVENYRPPEQPMFSLPGAVARIAFSLAVGAIAKIGKASAYDQEVLKKLATVLSGGDTDIMDKISAATILKHEQEAFMSLITQPNTLARMEHILVTGKPLRN